MKIQEPKETMLSTQEAAARLGVQARTITLWLRQGRMQGVKLSPRLWRIKESEVSRIQEEGLPADSKD